LTQYELPQNNDDDDCRMTLTSSVTRDGSISPNDMGNRIDLWFSVTKCEIVKATRLISKR